MDLKKIPDTIAKEDTPITLELNGPDSQPDFASDGTRATLTLVGAYSPRYRANERAWQASQRDAATDATPDEVSTAIAAWAVVDWHGIECDGAPLPCTQQNVIDVFTQAPWVQDQARIALNRRDRFFGAASTASSAS